MLEPRDINATSTSWSLLATEALTRFFVQPILQHTSFPVISCHTLSLFVPMHTLAHNVQTLLPASDLTCVIL